MQLYSAVNVIPLKTDFLSVGLGLERKNLECMVCEWGTSLGIGWDEKILMDQLKMRKI